MAGQKRKAEDDAEEVKAEEGGAVEEGAAAAADEPEAKKVKIEYAQVKLGPKKFDSPEEMIKYFSWILNNMTVNQDMNDYEYMVVDECLRKAHPEAEKKIGCGIKTFQIRTHPEHETRCYSVVRTDGSCEDFSYRKCVEVLFPGYTPPVRSQGNASGGRGGGGRGGGGRGGGRGGGGRGGGGRGGGGRGGGGRGGGGRGGGGRGGGRGRGRR